MDIEAVINVVGQGDAIVGPQPQGDAVSVAEDSADDADDEGGIEVVSRPKVVRPAKKSINNKKKNTRTRAVVEEKGYYNFIYNLVTWIIIKF